MRRTASEVVKNLEMRIARLERKASDNDKKQVESNFLDQIIQEMNYVMSYVQDFDPSLRMDSRFIKKMLKGQIVYLEGLREVSIKSSADLFKKELDDLVEEYSGLSIHMFSQTVPVNFGGPKFTLYLTENNGKRTSIVFDVSSINKIKPAVWKWKKLIQAEQ